MASLTSRKTKTDGSRNRRYRHDFEAILAESCGIVFSGGNLVLKLRDSDRTWTLSLTEAETAQLSDRFASRTNPTKRPIEAA